MPNSPNLGWKYSYEYYKNADFKYLKYNATDHEKNDALNTTKQLFQSRNMELFSIKLENYHRYLPAIHIPGFELATTYPGLLFGSGYQHEVKVEGELKLGFSFDHTTGLPIIPGSSIKGVLRSKWPVKNVEDHSAERKVFREFILWMMEEVNALIRKADKSSIEKLVTDNISEIDTIRFSTDNSTIDHLELEIFEGVDIKATQEKNPQSLRSPNHKNNWSYLNASEKDVFYEAVIAGGIGEFLGNDYITPHINREHPELSPFTSPTPLQFMKVLPGIPFRFQFDIKDSKVGYLTKGQKILLFRQLILTLGIGAKTNVGYGQFTEYNPNIGTNHHAGRPNAGETQDPGPEFIIPEKAIRFLKKNEVLHGKLFEIRGEYYIFSIEKDGIPFQVRKKKANTEEKTGPLELNAPVIIKIMKDYNRLEPLSFQVLKPS